MVAQLSQSIEMQLAVSIGPEVIKLFPCSTQLSAKFILRINVKMPTIVAGFPAFLVFPSFPTFS